MSVTLKVKLPRVGGVPQKVTGVSQPPLLTPLPMRSKVSQVGNVGSVVFTSQL